MSPLDPAPPGSNRRGKPNFAMIRKLARERFGYESLRSGQEEAILSVLGSRDTLVVQPTGSGKSAIYQLCGLLIDGPTVIVSPLIALQRDQVDSIQQKEVAGAAVLNSTLRVGEMREALRIWRKAISNSYFSRRSNSRSPIL